MANYDSDNDADDWNEDWSDDDADEDVDDEEVARCPECGGQVHSLAASCPACGYWLTAADRRRLWSNESKPKWVVITATVVLVALLLAALSLRF